ncbi:LysR family transcriptional regulator [Nostoc sp. C117]|uniref:LysR family transcriptional regulator n=1 Tax=Nostoc sp. C117 TaxID=3349875 RepID=UPI00370D9A22
MNKIKLEDITLNHIKILKAVDDCGSFSKAAQKLGYSQALISKKVKQIEDYFGVILLNRSPGSICLTSKGKKLISQTFHVVETIENLQEEFQATFSAEGEDLILGANSLILEVWLKQYLQRFQLCFPGRNIKEITVKNTRFFSNSQLLKIDILLNSCAGYKEEHHCTRLKTHKMLLVSFGATKYLNEHSLVKINDIDLADVVLLDEIHQELSKNGFLMNRLSGVQVLNSYQDVLNYASKNQKLTILPDFCQAEIISQYQVLTLPIQDINEYGIYLHVPRFSELLISAEGLVRSFRLDEENLKSLPNINIILGSSSLQEENILRIGIQRNSIGQFIAGYGTKYIYDLQRASSLENTIFKNIEINRNFELQILQFASGEQMNQQMKRGELDICILDDISLLNNGSQFFDDLSFGSKLIGIASYNLLGQDINIVLHKDSSINTIQDLKGKRISTLFGSNAHRFIITLFDIYDLDISKDCRLVNEEPCKASKSLANKTIDAYVCCHTFASILEGYTFVRKLPLSPQTNSLRIPSIRGIVCRSQFIKENPKIVVAYLHDLVVANYWFNLSPINAADLLTKVIDVRKTQVNQFFNPVFGNRIDPTLKPQWSWLLKTLNRRLEGKYGISLFDVDFWIDDYFLRLVYNLLNLDYHFHQVSFASEFSSSYFVEEQFSRHMKVLYRTHI